MTEEAIKSICKLAVEYGNRPLTREEKELLKQAVDASQSWEQLATTLMIYLGC